MRASKVTHRFLAAAIVFALVAPVVAIDAVAQEPPRRGDGAGDGPDRRDALRVVARFLDMGEEQVRAWGEIFRQQGEAVRPLAEQLRMSERRLREVLASDRPDPTVVGELVLTQRQLRRQIAEIHGGTADQLLGVLDAAQLEKVAGVGEAARICPVVPAFHALGLIAGEDRPDRD